MARGSQFPIPGKTAQQNFQPLETAVADIAGQNCEQKPAANKNIVANANSIFLPLPSGEALTLCRPTPNKNLFAAPENFFARTRANPNYGRPGWTRNCGRQFHRGCDIAPVAPHATGQTTTVMFSDCEKNIEYASTEPVFTCDDEIFAVADGRAVELCDIEAASPLGLHIVLEHRWPAAGKSFFTLYAHLSAIAVKRGDPVRGGQKIGTMGQTSRSPDSRNWMAIAPHLHFEVQDENRQPHDPELFLRTFLPR